jgi:hypothetical protein
VLVTSEKSYLAVKNWLSAIPSVILHNAISAQILTDHSHIRRYHIEWFWIVMHFEGWRLWFECYREHFWEWSLLDQFGLDMLLFIHSSVGGMVGFWSPPHCYREQTFRRWQRCRNSARAVARWLALAFELARDWRRYYIGNSFPVAGTSH